MKKLFFSLLLLLQAVSALAQLPTSITGKVLDSKNQKPVQNVVATIESTGQNVLTNAEGIFIFDDVPPGKIELKINSTGYVQQTFNLDVKRGETLDLGVISLELDITSEQQLGLITITDNDLGDDNSGSENTAGLLQASRDIFQQAAAFNWGQARFRIRGLDNEYGTTLINGVVMNKLYDGRPQWSNWGGLNDATRNQEFTMGSAPSDYTFGGILGTQEINTRASIYRPGGRISFSGSNTTYNWRTMATYASGLNKDGWAYVISGSRRWAEEANFEGTDYDANSFFASVEKRIGNNHAINFTSIYAYNSRGKNSPNTQEMTDIAGVKYNSYWGYQNGEKRNSRDKDVEEPILMLTHFWKIRDNSTLTTNVAYQFGKIGNSRIDFQNANNPDPTYYRNLPSYFTSMYDSNSGEFIGDQEPQLTNAANAPFLTNQQIDWDALYRANRNTATGRSAYVLYEDRTDDKTFTANTILRSLLSEHVTLNAGASYRYTESHNFQNLLDLLGGEYFEDIDNFYVGDFSQSDLNNPNRLVGVGDTYGYNYKLYANVADAFAQFKFTFRKVDFYLAGNFSRSDYQRDGLYRNGLYPNNSFGRSEMVSFNNYNGKGGVNYKINGRNMITFNGIYMTKAPTLRNTFPNARLNNNIVAGLESEIIYGGDINYIIRAPRLKGRVTGYYNMIQNAVETSFFYGEGVFEGSGSDADAFIAETVRDIDKRMFGGEIGLEYQITSTIKLMGSAAYGQFTYNNNPSVSVNNDALAVLANADDGITNITTPATQIDFGQAALKNYRLPGVPQQAYSVGVEYRDPHYWWIGANANYLASNYIDVSALLRTSNFFRDPETGYSFANVDEEYARELLKQEKFDNFYLFNLQGGKSWKFGDHLVGIFASINNVLNKTYKTGGFEQARNANYNELSLDVASGTPPFAPRYFYGYGRTYFVNLYFTF